MLDSLEAQTSHLGASSHTGRSNISPTLTTPVADADATVHAPAKPLTHAEGAEFQSLIESLIPCRNGDPELWFAEQATQVSQAKALCAQCPIAAACLEGAVARQEPWGVWGGEIIVDGQVVAQKRGRGRPRKVESIS